MLNQACFAVKIPEDSLLHPSKSAAVCAGNVLTSQRIVDVVLMAFDACAASQGCTKYADIPYRPMFQFNQCPSSNLTFGAGGKDASGVVRAGWGYYEVHPLIQSELTSESYLFRQ